MNRYDAIVESCDAADGCSWLRVGRQRLAARRWPGMARGQKVAIAIRPEDVVLCESHPGRTSARNVLPGHVAAVRRGSDALVVELRVGLPLHALVTRQAVRDLGLRRGTPVFALVKATAIVPHGTARAPFLVSLLGRRGVIAPERLALLRAVRDTGSLAQAARACAITYRSAWLWARAVGRAWGKPLVAAVHGGRAGGGTALTAEGHAVLALADEIARLARGAAVGSSATTRGESSS